MSTTFHTSAEELVGISAAARRRGERCELVEGKISMMSPAGWKHGKVVSHIQTLLAAYIAAHDLGLCFGAETGFLIARDPDTVRAPDFAFVAKRNLPKEEPSEAYWPGAPDLAIEVLSPSDVAAEIEAKTTVWLTSGVHEVWNIDYEAKSITVHCADSEPIILSGHDLLESPDLLPGFRVATVDLFQ